MEEAQAAAERIAQGTTFVQLAAERGLKDKDIDLGTVAKSRRSSTRPWPTRRSRSRTARSARRCRASSASHRHGAQDRARAGEAFPSSRAATQAGDRARARQERDVHDIHDKIEDARAGGGTLAEAAQNLKLPVRTDRSDRPFRPRPGRQAGRRLPDRRRRGHAAFSTDVGVDTDPLQVQGGGYVWFEVDRHDAVARPHARRGQGPGRARWRDDEIATRLKTKAAEILDKLKTGSALAELATADGVKLDKADKLAQTRQARPGAPGKGDRRGIPHREGRRRQRRGRQADRMVVFRVTDVTMPPLDAASPQTKQLDNTHQDRRCPTTVQPIYRAARKRARHHHQSGRADPGLGSGTADSD